MELSVDARNGRVEIMLGLQASSMFRMGLLPPAKHATKQCPCLPSNSQTLIGRPPIHCGWRLQGASLPSSLWLVQGLEQCSSSGAGTELPATFVSAELAGIGSWLKLYV